MSKPPRTSHYVDIVSLFDALEAERARRGISWNRVAKECGGFSRTLFVRLAERDPDATIHVDILVSLLVWLGRPVNLDRFVVRTPTSREDEIVDHTAGKLIRNLSPEALGDLTRQLSYHLSLSEKNK